MAMVWKTRNIVICIMATLMPDYKCCQFDNYSLVSVQFASGFFLLAKFAAQNSKVNKTAAPTCATSTML